MMESYQTLGQCKAGAAAPLECNAFLARLRSQLTASLEHLQQQQHTPRGNERLLQTPNHWLSQDRRLDPCPSQDQHLLSQNQRLSQESWLDQGQRLQVGQRLSEEPRLSQDQHLLSWNQPQHLGRWLEQGRRLHEGQRLSQDQHQNQGLQLTKDQQLSEGQRRSQEQWASQDPQARRDQQSNHKRRRSQEEQLNQVQTLSQEQRLSPERQVGLEERLCQERRLRPHQRLSQALSVMSTVMSRMATQSKDINTFEDAAVLFSLEEWNEWKEVEGLFQVPEMKTDFAHHAVQDSDQTHKSNLLKCYDPGDGRKFETGSARQSPSILNTKSEMKYPENKGKKLPTDKIRSIKEGLKNLLCANKKTLSIHHSVPETPPTPPVNTGNETDGSSAANEDLAGDGEQRSRKRPTICYDCGKIFFCQVRLFRHQEMHRALKPYECSECGEPFFSQTLLIRHHAIHPELKTYNCTQCGKPFISYILLLKHQEVHRLLKPYNCTECGKVVLSEALFLRHQKMHLAVKPYNCSVCGKNFKNSSRFHYHRSTHTGVKAFECSECGMGFNRKGPLMWHSRNHHGKRSTQETVSKANHDVGLNTSSSEAPYKLGKGKKPGSIKKRRWHIARAGERTFACNKCEKKFASRYFLKMHRENIHGEPNNSLSKQNKKLLLKLKIVRRWTDAAGESSPTWQWSIVTDEDIQGRQNP